MALYRFSLTIITRSHGQSACAAAAYISGTKITNEYDGITHDYRKKQNVEYSEVMLPEHAPEAYRDSATMWSAIELMEKSSTAQLARSIQLSLPVELMQGKRPEEYKQEYIELARDFFQKTFVDDGMVCLFAYHNPPMMNSRKQPIDINGRVTHNPAEYVYNNPHIHVQLSMRPIAVDGKWAPKSQKLYVCEKDGLQQTFSAAALKETEGWEKVWKYRTPEGQTVWRTRTYSVEHLEEGLILSSNSPKSVKVKDPIVAKWDDPETLEQWRAAWADAVNMALEQEKLDVRVDHRSYERQGMNLIPMINESKAVVMEEKRRLEEYKRKVDAGEPAVLIHTEIREQNILIRQHNEQIKIIAELKKLQVRMDKLLQPIRIRMQQAAKTIAEGLERLRAEIILIRSRLKKAKETKWDADQKIREYTNYLNDMTPSDLQLLQDRHANLVQQLSLAKGLFRAKLREELFPKIEAIENRIALEEENQRITIDVENRIATLKESSDQVQISINDMDHQIDQKVNDYRSLSSDIPPQNAEKVAAERLQIRPEIQEEILGKRMTSDLKVQADKFDSEMGDFQITVVPKSPRLTMSTSI